MKIKKLPESEFQIMKVIWQLESPTTTAMIMDKLQADWKPTTILTFLSRLVNKGYLKCLKKGKENYYTPQVIEQDYLNFESKSFMERYQQPSLVSLINNFYTETEISDKDIEELSAWLESKKKSL